MRGAAERSSPPRLTSGAGGWNCPICGAEPDEGRLNHLRREHPRYWVSFVTRVVSPWAFLALMVGLALAGAPGWLSVLVTFAFVGASLWARRRATAERSRKGVGLSPGQWVRGLGLGLVMMGAAFFAIYLLSAAGR